MVPPTVPDIGGIDQVAEDRAAGNSALRENMEERNMAWEVVLLLQLLCME